jgi:hypothetical protein
MPSVIPKSNKKELNNSFWLYQKIITLHEIDHRGHAWLRLTCESRHGADRAAADPGR